MSEQKMDTIELTPQQRENLVMFMQRIQLTGAEVPQYIEIAAALNKPVLNMMNAKKVLEDEDKV